MSVAAFRLTANADVDRIVAGEALTITTELFDTNTGQVYPLDDATGASAVFLGTNAPIIKTSGSGVALDSSPGRLRVTLSSADTLALLQGDGISWEVHVTKPDGSKRIAQLGQALDVVPALA